MVRDDPCLSWLPRHHEAETQWHPRSLVSRACVHCWCWGCRKGTACLPSCSIPLGHRNWLSKASSPPPISGPPFNPSLAQPLPPPTVVLYKHQHQDVIYWCCLTLVGCYPEGTRYQIPNSACTAAVSLSCLESLLSSFSPFEGRCHLFLVYLLYSLSFHYLALQNLSQTA